MSLDFVKRNLKAVIEALLPALSPYARYAAAVVKQNTDFTLDVTPDDPAIPPMTALIIKHGLPGVKVTVNAGARVLVGFERGERTRPFVELWESGTVAKLEIDATDIVLNGGTKAVARVDDSVAVGTLTGSNGGGPVAFVFTPTGGAPSLPLTTIPITAKVAAGAPGVKA